MFQFKKMGFPVIFGQPIRFDHYKPPQIGFGRRAPGHGDELAMIRWVKIFTNERITTSRWTPGIACGQLIKLSCCDTLVGYYISLFRICVYIYIYILVGAFNPSEKY